MKLFDLFGKRAKAQPVQEKEKTSDTELPDAYSGMRVEVTAADDRLLFAAKLLDLHGNQAELQLYSEAAISQESEPFRVQLRGYSDYEKKAVSMEGLITPMPKNMWHVDELTVCRVGNDRAFFRLTTNLDVTTTMFGDPEKSEKPCKLLNISVGGAGISSQFRYHKGDKFLLKVKLLEDKPASVIYGQVVRVTEKGGSSFEYGCQFLELTEEEQEEITQNIFAAQRLKRSRS